MLNRHVYLFGSNLFVASQRATNNRARRDPAVPNRHAPHTLLFVGDIIALTRRYGRLCHYTQQSPVWTRLCSVVTLPVTRCQPSDSQGSVARPYPCEDAITGNVCKNKCVTSLFLYNLASCFQFNYSKQTVYTILTLIIYSS